MCHHAGFPAWGAGQGSWLWLGSSRGVGRWELLCAFCCLFRIFSLSVLLLLFTLFAVLLNCPYPDPRVFAFFSFHSPPHPSRQREIERPHGPLLPATAQNYNSPTDSMLISLWSVIGAPSQCTFLLSFVQVEYSLHTLTPFHDAKLHVVSGNQEKVCFWSKLRWQYRGIPILCYLSYNEKQKPPLPIKKKMMHHLSQACFNLWLK